VTAHEFQHSIMVPNAKYLDGAIHCAQGHYTLPQGPGLGVRPSAEALRILEH